MQKNNTELLFRQLEIDDAGILSSMLLNLPKEYYTFFTPFQFDFDTIATILTGVKNDKYWGIFVNNELAGFFMLRGFDQGFEIPAYGIIVSNSFANKGLASLSLQYCISWCKFAGIKKIMLKVHPENLTAKRIYEKQGFVQDGFDAKNNNLIYYKELN